MRLPGRYDGVARPIVTYGEDPVLHRRCAAVPRPAAVPTQTAAYPTPAARESRQTHGSRAAAACPKPATGWPRRGSATSRSAAAPRASPAAPAYRGQEGALPDLVL